MEGLEARESERRLVTCERCFARVPAGESICPECGAPMKSEGAIPSVENALHTELARANLARVRGEYKTAEEQCLSLLRRYPNSDAAHTLMGDIYADQELWDEASQWYELALDINPESASDRAKLDQARKRHEDLVQHQTDVQIGLPAEVRNIPLIAVSIAAIIFALGFIAVTLSSRAMAHRPDPVVVQDRITATPAVPAPTTAVTSSSTPPQPVTPTVAIEDRQMSETLIKNGIEGVRVIGVEHDPRDSSVSVTFTLRADDETRRIAAQVGYDALTQFADAQVVTLRGLKEGHLIYVADVSRAKLSEAGNTLTTPDTGPLPDAWVNLLLQKEWQPKSQANPAPSSTPSGP